ncbi:MAG: nitroreductase, partial [Caulobacteraceae bacterium]|nr:nitroreductase [Caulobacteraceae bacterium]
MTVTEAVEKRISVRAFRDTPVPAEAVREILSLASRAPSGGNLQPWRVYALAGEALAELKALAAEQLKAGLETAEYHVYPPDLWDPFRSRRFAVGEALYATIGVERADRAGRLAQFAKNAAFFDAPVGLFFCLDRNLGPPQWSDLGMYMQTVILLAVERGLDTCAQEYWAAMPKLVSRFLDLPDDHM